MGTTVQVKCLLRNGVLPLLLASHRTHVYCIHYVQMSTEHMRPQAPAYLRIPYTNYPALACYWVRRPQYVRENIIQGWYRGTYTSVLGTYRTYTTRLGTVLRYVPSAQIDLGTVRNTAYRTGYRTVGTHLGRNPYL